MKRLYELKEFIAIICVLLLVGCGKKPENLIKEWKDEGWSYVTTHGKKGKVQRTGALKSDKAQSVEASWVESGKRKTKIYHQNNYHYAVLRFFKEDEDEFVVVLKKRK